ncbi:uncharacterized protein LOC128504370 [Spea bombifrons]|uniref:uncharacterized protein LOC128504370 n=1 Tax=Spea bombifrons TaxID=233779 RepID=UPI00234B6F0C|nr:uncharacterized protein LOC128504370 [Spea bombifrons]
MDLAGSEIIETMEVLWQQPISFRFCDKAEEGVDWHLLAWGQVQLRFSLSCISCVSQSEVSCTGVGTTCDSSDTCLSHSYMVGQTRVFNRACGKSLFCGLALNVPLLQFKMATSCCNVDNCEPVPPSFSPPQGVKNGLLCPECFGTTAQHCVSPGGQECTGNERKCGTIVVSARSGPVLYFRGCVMDPICNFGNNSVNVFGEDIIFRITCRDPEIPSINTSFGTPTTQSDKPGTQPTWPESQTTSIETPSIGPHSPPASPHSPPASPHSPPASPHSPPASPHSPPASPHSPPASPHSPPASPHSPPASPHSPPASPHSPPASPHSPPASPHSLPASPESPVTIPDGPNTKGTTSNAVTNTYFYYTFWSLALTTLIKTLV